MEEYSLLTKLSSFAECFLKKQTIEKYKSKKEIQNTEENGRRE